MKTNIVCVYQIVCLINTIYCRRIVITGNEDTFRRLARNLVPARLANKPSQPVPSPATADYVDVNNPQVNVNYNPNFQLEERARANQGEMVYEEDGQPQYRPGEFAPIQNMQGHRYKEKAPIKPKPQRTIKVNLDELVNKVRDRIFSELQSPRAADLYMPLLLNSSLKDQIHGAAANIQVNEDTVPSPVDQGRFIEDTPKAPARIRKVKRQRKLVAAEPGPANVNRPKQYQETPKKNVGEVIESTDLYQKVGLKKYKRDSYEDYVTPKKDNDPFETEEESPKASDVIARMAQGAHDVNPSIRPSRPLPRFVAPTDINGPVRNQPQSYAEADPQQSYAQPIRQVDPGTIYKRPKSKRNPENVQIPSNQYYRESPQLKTTRVIMTRPSTTTTQTPQMVEYVYEDEGPNQQQNDPQSENEEAQGDPLGVTQFIDTNYKDYPLPDTKPTTRQVGYVNTKRVTRKIVTNMPTKERYKMTTPNYYDKLPRIAEKYNFDEPIPEKDREEEKLQHSVLDPAAQVNGKVQIL